MAREVPSYWSSDHGDRAKWARAHALAVVARRLLLDAAIEIRGYGYATDLKKKAQDLEGLIRDLDKYGNHPEAL